jgi:DNA invertase Pin-like site-specific DNA recombinase
VEARSAWPLDEPPHRKSWRTGGAGIGFRSLTENIDTTTPGGMLVFNIFGSLAQFERDLIRERTQAGLRAARARQQGWPPSCCYT